MFASAVNRRCTRFFSRLRTPGCEDVDTFTADWGGAANRWIFPPFIRRPQGSGQDRRRRRDGVGLPAGVAGPRLVGRRRSGGAGGVPPPQGGRHHHRRERAAAVAAPKVAECRLPHRPWRAVDGGEEPRAPHARPAGSRNTSCGPAGEMPAAEQGWCGVEVPRWVTAGYLRRLSTAAGARSPWVSSSFVLHDSKDRLVVDLRLINRFIQPRPFKYQRLARIFSSLVPGDHLVSWDVMDAFYQSSAPPTTPSSCRSPPRWCRTWRGGR